MKRKILTILLFCTFIPAIAQETEIDDTDIIIENLLDLDDSSFMELLEDARKFHFLLISAEYNSQAYFLGRDLGLDQFSLSPQIMYQNHLGIYLGISGAVYNEFDPKWDLTTLTAGYGIDFGKNENFRAELGYSRYIFSESTSNDFENSLDLSLFANTAGNEFGGAIKSAYLFGDKTGFQTSITLFSEIKLANLNSMKGTQLNFEPSLDIVFASENIDTSRIDNLGLDSPFINNIVNQFETFSLRNTQLRLPLVLDLNDLNIEAGFNINFPSAFNFERELDNSTFFNLGINYLISL